MITGNQSGMIGKLEASIYQFHMTGSRVFGTATPASDYDYFAQFSAEIRDYLFNLGFDIDDVSGYLTSCLVLKYGNIHVQLVDDFQRKLTAQNLILANPYLLGIIQNGTKTVNKYLWSYLLSL